MIGNLMSICANFIPTTNQIYRKKETYGIRVFAGTYSVPKSNHVQYNELSMQTALTLRDLCLCLIIKSILPIPPILLTFMAQLP